VKRLPRILLGTSIIGGVATLVVELLTSRHKTALKSAVDGVAPPVAPGSPSAISVHLTGYWPFQAGLSDKERKMEGAPVDATGRPLYTVEDFFAGKSDFVSLSGDLQGHKGTIFPYGQKILIPWGDKTVVGRVTDTGSHFHGIGKVFRVVGAEPIDVCVASSSTVIPKKTVDAQVIVGDHFDKAGAQLALDKAGKPQTGLVGIDIFAN